MSAEISRHDVFRAAFGPEKITLLSGRPRGVIPPLTDAYLQALARHAGMALEANRKFNLTAITDPAEMAAKHYLDSLSCCLAVDLSSVESVCDVGSGAGFPGIPLAILFPQTRFALVESNQKKARFLEAAIKDLGLANCQVIPERAESLGRGELRETFGVVISRGVAPLPVLAELCLPLVRIGGCFLAMRGRRGGEEVERCEQRFALLGAGKPEVLRISIAEAGERVMVTAGKETSTPERFPRRPGIPQKRPLI